MPIALQNTPSRYGAISQLFHWLIVVLILFQYTWAWRIDNVEGIRQRFELITQHKTMGMLILILAVLRLLWRLFNRPPAAPASMKQWERWAASTGHWLLYGLILAMPLTGWLYSSAAGYADYWWGPVSFPGLIESSERLEAVFGQTHRVLAWSLGILAGIHVLAALRHHFIKRDDVLTRMLPRS